MKRWTALACTLLLLASAPIALANDETHQRFDLERLVSWIIDLWLDHVAAETPETPDGDRPQAFYQGTGPYIVPVGLVTAPEQRNEKDQKEPVTEGDN